MFEHSIPPEARPAFCLDPPRSSVRAWCMFRNGRAWRSPERTKRSLLIGYDMIPLHGLRRCERLLAERGIIARRCTIETAAESTLLGVSRYGDLQRDACCWSTFGAAYTDCRGRLRQIAGASFSLACGWVATQLDRTPHWDDARTVRRWRHTLTDYTVDRWTVKDKRRATTTRRLIAQCAAVFERHDYRIVPVRIVPNPLTP